MPSPFPHLYETSLVRTMSSRGTVEAPQRPAIPTSPSPQLDGDETAWSPEQLLMSALAQSLLTTFEAFAARDRITVHEWHARIRSTVVQTSRGPTFTKFVVDLDLDVDDNERVRTTLEDAQRHCLIANVLTVPIEIVANIRTDVRKAG